MTTKSAAFHKVCHLALVVCGATILAACGGADHGGVEEGRPDLRLPTNDEVCALIAADDLPGDAFRVVPGSGSVSVDRGGRRAATYDPSTDSSLEEGLVPADASCSWVGDSGTTAGLITLDYDERPDLLAIPVEELIVGSVAEEHPLLSVDGFDRLAVTEPSSFFASAAAVAGPYVLTAHASFLVDGGQEQTAAFFELLFRRWLATAALNS